MTPTCVLLQAIAFCSLPRSNHTSILSVGNGINSLIRNHNTIAAAARTHLYTSTTTEKSTMHSLKAANPLGAAHIMTLNNDCLCFPLFTTQSARPPCLWNEMHSLRWVILLEFAFLYVDGVFTIFIVCAS
jgi:hypothetical protein